MKGSTAKREEAGLVLDERALMKFASDEFGWTTARPELSARGEAELVTLLSDHVPSGKVQSALSILRIGFADAVEAGHRERRAVVHAESSKEAKKPSSKLGPYLRARIDLAISALEADNLSPDEVCSSILQEPIFSRLVDIHLEERIRPLITDPVSRAPSVAMEHLPDVLQFLRDAIHAGIKTGKVEASHDILARTVLSALRRASGQAPRRNYDAIKSEDSGYGLACCGILAREMNDALPPKLRRVKPLKMARAWRRAIEKDAAEN